ncbi:MAG: DUF1559 domain-containing protein [Planctomycetes bacterium]|nr:DUF1559 domain-containing protein [Planctomycetota bacterium]
MKQIGIALHHCHDTHQKLPPSLGYFPGGYGPALFHLLPFVEQNSLYQSSLVQNYNFVTDPFATNFTGHISDPLIGTPMKLYLCPSDPSVVNGGYCFSRDWMGASSYGMNNQVFGSPWINGIGSWQNWPQLPASFSDGTSSTVVVAEKYGGCPVGSNYVYNGVTANGSAWANNGFNQLAPIFAVTQAFSTYESVPVPHMFQVQPSPWTTTCNSALAITPHTAMNTLFADGHIESLTGNINPTTVWWRLLTPAAGDIPDSY